MTWWTSIFSYLSKNSLRRWVEQPLSLLAKQAIAALIGLLAAVIILGSGFLQRELEARLSDREVLTAIVTENVSSTQSGLFLDGETTEDTAWQAMGSDVLVGYQVAELALVNRSRRVPIIAINDPESHGVPSGLALMTNDYEVGALVSVDAGPVRSEAVVVRPPEKLKELSRGRDVLVADVARVQTSLERGFIRMIIIPTDSIDGLQRVHKVAAALNTVDERNVAARSSLDLLLQIETFREMQGYVLIAVVIGAALVLGLVCGALAWLEFREERYLMALIRSFGVGKVPLLVFGALENCFIAVTGVLLGYLLLTGFVNLVNVEALGAPWLTDLTPLHGIEGILLLSGAALGGLLTAVPIAIGLRKPLGLILQ